MSVITMPATLRVSKQDFGVRRFDLSFESGDTGATQTAVLAPPRWTCALGSPEQIQPHQAAQWRAMVLALDGRVNQLAMHFRASPQPLGTARGEWLAVATAAAGATTLVVSAPGGTLLAGDWIGVHQAGTARQMLHVQADTAVVGGQMQITFKPALRTSVPAGSAVVWDRPTALMRQTGNTSGWVDHPGRYQGNFSLDLMESWE